MGSEPWPQPWPSRPEVALPGPGDSTQVHTPASLLLLRATISKDPCHTDLVDMLMPHKGTRQCGQRYGGRGSPARSNTGRGLHIIQMDTGVV